jgi:hypothetical protein
MTISKVSAELNGVALVGPVEWELRAGVEPVTKILYGMPTDRPAFEGMLFQRNNITLTIVDRDHQGGEQKHEFKGLSVIDVATADDPDHIAITVTDRRYWLRYKHIYRQYNIRRRIGTRRRGQWQEVLQQDVQPDLGFRASTLFNGDLKWEAAQILFDLFDQIGELQFISIQDSARTALDNFRMEDIVIDSTADVAVSTVLSLMPGTKLYVSENGDYIVDSMASGREVFQWEQSGYSIVGGGYIRGLDNSAIAPVAVECLFDRQFEVRFDFLDDDFNPETTLPGTPPPRYIENVLPLPDFQQVIDQHTRYLGSFVTIDDAIRSWTSPPGNLVSFGTRGDNYIALRRAFMPYVDLLASLGVTGSLNVNDQQSNWFARVAALRAHYRQTFQLPKGWVDAMQDLTAEMVSVIDPVTGQRAPARVWADHSYTRSLKALFHADIDDAYPMIQNVPGYPGRFADLSDYRPSPAKVTVLDADQGVFNISYQLDPYANVMTYLPSQVDNVPKMGAVDRILAAFSMDSVSADHPTAVTMEPPALAREHKLAVVLSAVPLTPNSNDTLHKVTVDYQDVKDRMITGDRAGFGELRPRGPVMQVRISPTIAMALFRWGEDTRTLTERAFGRGTPITSEELDNSGMLLNPDQSDPNGAAGLRDIAEAAALVIYTRYANGLQGGKTSRMDGRARPEGKMTSIIHLVAPDGRANTRYTIEPTIDIPDLLAFADERTRKVILRQSRMGL